MPDSHWCLWGKKNWRKSGVSTKEMDRIAAGRSLSLLGWLWDPGSQDAEILLKATIKPKRDAFDFHVQSGGDAYILYFWIGLSKERVCIREFKLNSEDLHCISSPEDTSLSPLQKYQSVFDLTADFSPPETNQHGWQLCFIFFFLFPVQLLVAALMRKCCNLFSPPLWCPWPCGLVCGLKSKSEASRGRQAR